jgi:hypothetical protein
VRITYRPENDEAIIYVSEEKQSQKGGGTYLVCINDETADPPSSIDVQLGFEGKQRLLFIIVRPASVALPADLLASAERPRVETSS